MSYSAPGRVRVAPASQAPDRRPGAGRGSAGLGLPPGAATGGTGISLGVAVLLLLGFGVLGAAADVVRHATVGTLFAVGLTAGALLATALVRRRQVWRVVIAVPLVFLALLGVGALTSGHADPVVWLGLAFVFKAPAVLVGTTAAFVIAVVRANARR